MKGYTFTDKIDLDKVYTLEENTREEMFEAMRDKSIIRYRTKTIRAGDYLYSEIFPIWDINNPNHFRKAKTSEAQKNLNHRNSRKHLTWMINNNFCNKDMWTTWTYDNDNLPKSEEEAENNIKNFMRRCRYWCKKNGYKGFKYAYFNEWEKDVKKGKIRCHSHIITNFPSMDKMEKLWRFGGRNNLRKLKADENGYEGLIRYCTKDPKGKKRYVMSKGMKKYTVTTADRKISRTRASKIALGEISASAFFEKSYPGYKYNDIKIKFGDDIHVSGVYLYVRMKKIIVSHPHKKTTRRNL